MNDKLKCGIIGAGNIAQRKHLPGYAALSGQVEIAAVCDSDPQRLKKTAETYNIPYATDNYKNILAMPEIDFVVVCLPNYLHAPVSIEAMRAGKHVHCDKPMALNGAQAQEMVDARNETGRQLMVGLNQRFRPISQYVKRYTDDGNLGQVYMAKCGCLRKQGLPANEWFQNKELSGGGVLIDLGVHFIDLPLHMMGFPDPVSATAHAYSTFGGGEQSLLYAFEGAQAGWRFDVEDAIVGTLELSGGIHMSFEFTWASNSAVEMMYYELYGTRGNLRFQDGEATVSTVMGGQFVNIKPEIQPHMFKETEFTHFLNSVRTGREPTVSVAEQGVMMMGIIDKIYQAAGEKKQVLFAQGRS